MNTIKIEKIELYSSNATVWCNDGQICYYHVDYDFLPQKAVKEKGTKLKKAIVKYLRLNYIGKFRLTNKEVVN